MRSRRRADILGLVSAALPILYVLFAVSDHYDFWDGPRGLNAVKRVAANMETSYAPATQRQFRPGDDGFAETLALIRRYSEATLYEWRKPIVIARYVALASGKLESGTTIIAEWTSPATPLLILYGELPLTLKDDAVIVGSIGDLRTWIDRSKKDFHFLVQDVALAGVSMAAGALIWFRRRERPVLS